MYIAAHKEVSGQCVQCGLRGRQVQAPCAHPTAIAQARGRRRAAGQAASPAVGG